MRVICQSVDDLIANLKDVDPSTILQRIVRVSVSKRPLDTSDRFTAIKFSVILQAAAVVNIPDEDGQYLLDYGEDCGLDFLGADPDMSGSGRAAALKERIVVFCDDQGLKVRPGIVET